MKSSKVNIENLCNDAKRESSKIDELRSIVDDDTVTDDLVSDFLEGETETFELIDLVLSEIADREILIEGLKLHIQAANSRKSRISNAIDKLRASLAFIMKRIDQDSVVRPAYTISLKETPENLIIDEESDLPAKFFKRPDPIVDKKSLKEALKLGEEVEGAFLTDKGFTISIRKK
jgi:Lhr-like helicase